MNHVLHVSAATAKETDDGVVETITLTAVSIDPSELIPLVGEQVILQTPGQKGRKFGGDLTVLMVKDGKHGPEVTVKVAGATELNGLVGTNVTIEAAQMGFTYSEEPHAALRGKGPLGPLPPAVERVLDEAARPIGEALAKEDLEGDGKPDNPYSGVVLAIEQTMPPDDLDNF